MNTTRRSFLLGAGALLPAPSIVRASALMPINGGRWDLIEMQTEDFRARLGMFFRNSLTDERRALRVFNTRGLSVTREWAECAVGHARIYWGRVSPVPQSLVDRVAAVERSGRRLDHWSVG